MRKTLDKLISWTGLILAVTLLVAGGLLTWASNFVAGNVHDQLSAQHITMPPAAALTTQDMKDNLAQYSGQPMTTGDQAKAYADHFILAHMNEASGGKAYSEVSGAYLKLAADPTADVAGEAPTPSSTRFLFSGDLGHYDQPIVKDPAPPPACDYLMCESTYGNRLHGEIADGPDHQRGRRAGWADPDPGVRGGEDAGGSVSDPRTGGRGPHSCAARCRRFADGRTSYAGV